MDSDILARAKRQWMTNLDGERLVAFLKSEGLNQIDTIKTFRELTSCSLSAAKAFVAKHPAWATESENADAFHEELVGELKNRGYLVAERVLSPEELAEHQSLQEDSGIIP